MSTSYRFTAETIKGFEVDTGEVVNLDLRQQTNLQNEGSTTLSFLQLEELLQRVVRRPLAEYIVEEAEELQPISLALFVINKNTWKLMAKKTYHADKMNPMITFPWFYWSKKASRAGGDDAISRDIDCSGIKHFSLHNNELVITGFGGDFAGILDEHIVTQSHQGASILIPQIPGRRILISKYDLEPTKILFNLNLCRSELYHLPDPSFDYRFSESPEDFHKHGLCISADEGGVALSIGSKPAVPLAGSVKTYICGRMEDLYHASIPLRYHLWMFAMHRLLTKKEFI